MVKKVVSVLSAFFLRNVTRCYAKNIIVQTFSVLLSHYHRITIALPSYTNACVIQVICFVGVNVQDFSFFRTYKKGLKAVPLHSHSSAMDTLTRWGAMRTHWGGIEETLRRHWGDIGLYWEVQSIAIIVPFFWQFARIKNFCIVNSAREQLYSKK